jgi:hypothetical protein
MMRDAVINVGVAQRGSGMARLLGPLVVVGAVVALLWAVVSALGAAEQAVMFQDPSYRAATERASVAQADLAAAKAEHDAASIRHSQAIEASWDPITAGVVHLVGLGLLVVVPLAVLLACGLLIRRHMSLPTRDGRVPIVGLDRELSWDALNRYQALQGGRGARLEALPVGRHQGYGDELLEPKEAPAPESESKP